MGRQMSRRHLGPYRGPSGHRQRRLKIPRAKCRRFRDPSVIVVPRTWSSGDFEERQTQFMLLTTGAEAMIQDDAGTGPISPEFVAYPQAMKKAGVWLGGD